jgi:phosphoserine phosphatase RsbU/P
MPFIFSGNDLDEMRMQRVLFGLLAIGLLSTGYALLIKVIVKANKQRTNAEAEISIAQNIQRSLLPATMLNTGWCVIAGSIHTASEVGGDYFDIITLSDDELLIVVADASGHGTGAGILSAMTKSGIIQELIHTSSPDKILEHVNTMMCQVTKKNMFVTCALLLLNKKNQTATIATAGHPPVLHYSLQKKLFEELRPQNLPLGVKKESSFMQTTIRFVAGDRFFIFTDGLIEAANSTQELFGMENLKSTLAAHSIEPEAECNAVIAAVKQFTGASDFKDDVTIVSVECREPIS